MNERHYEMDEISEKRLWKVLDDITKRLSNIESKLSEIVRLEEKVNNHHETLKRYGHRLDKYDERILEIEKIQSKDEGRNGVSGKVITWVVAGITSIIATTATFVITKFGGN